MTKHDHEQFHQPGADLGFRHCSEFLVEALAGTADAMERGGRLAGLSTGLGTLDRITGGLCDTDLIVLAGATSMGKTALAVNVANHVARSYDATARHNPGGVVGFVSMEMAGKQLMGRILADAAGIGAHKLRRGDIAEADFMRLRAAAAEQVDVPLYVDETTRNDIDAVRRKSLAMRERHGLDLLVLDYVQFMEGRAKAGGSRVREVADISIGLKELAKDLRIPVVALSQLKRGVESREDKRPVMSDLSDASALEKDADVVMFVHRDHYYLRDREPEPGTEAHVKWREAIARTIGRASIIVSKNRSGLTGTVHCRFDDETTRFSDLPEA